ncbi:MAG: hypothetical protein GY737_29305, partial [Desulfobacteraceae bacterium]|nr:hypothetical protein [Desulfobacteraceae bacterium]
MVGVQAARVALLPRLQHPRLHNARVAWVAGVLGAVLAWVARAAWVRQGRLLSDVAGIAPVLGVGGATACVALAGRRERRITAGVGGT